MARRSARNYYKAVLGITDGANHYTEGMVFPASEALDKHFAETGGVDLLDRTLYVKSSEDEYKKYVASTTGEALASAEPEVEAEPAEADAEADAPAASESEES
jgi:hypothetical protein